MLTAGNEKPEIVDCETCDGSGSLVDHFETCRDHDDCGCPKWIDCPECMARRAA